jgi:hypothetical protein
VSPPRVVELLYPQLEGFYIAEGQFTLLTALRLPFGEPDKTPTTSPGRGRQEDLWSKVSCAGAI